MRCADAEDPFHEDLIAFAAGDGGARDRLPRLARPEMLRSARAQARDLPDDLHEEIVQQAFINLLLEVAKWDPARGSASTFLRLMVRNAVRQIKALYHLPGTTTRNRRGKPKADQQPDEAVIVRLVELDEATEGALIDPSVSPARVQAAHDVNVVLADEPEVVQLALWRVHVAGETVESVADQQHMSRHKLGRAMAAAMQRARDQLAA